MGDPAGGSWGGLPPCISHNLSLIANVNLFVWQVEYRPCVIASNCWELIREFLQGFMGSHVPNAIPAYFTTQSPMNPNHTKQNDIYQPIDTIQQYLEHFGNYRKQTKAPGATSVTAASGSATPTSTASTTATTAART